MTNKKQILDYAFTEAVSTVNLNSVTKELAEDIIATAMFGYAVHRSPAGRVRVILRLEGAS